MSDDPKSEGPTLVTSREIQRPFVTKAASERTESDTDLPLGVLLSGGKKLHEAGLTGKNVRVAVIDSGVDAEHPAFNGCVKQQKWFAWGTPLEEDDHGTHVAGTIHFMAPDAEIYDYRVFGEEGFPVEDAIATSIFEAVFDGCHVINMSLGGRWPSVAIRTAVQYAHSRGVHVVCAAGNEGDDNPLTNERSFPALWEEAISVAAAAKKEGIPVAFFSNSNPQVDYAGIGVDVVSMKPGGGFQTMSGTSMASPHVAGLVCAILTPYCQGPRFPFLFKKAQKGECTLSDKDLRHKLDKLAIDIGVEGPDNASGVGFLTYLTKQEKEELLKKE